MKELNIDHLLEPDAAIYFLKRRGFLIDRIGDNYRLSDNSHTDDKRYMLELLKGYDLGYLDEHDTIHIEHEENAKQLKQLFLPTVNQVRIECCYINRGWSNYKRRWHGYKVPVKCLESNIAYYVKAVSACGMITGASCDGNHPNATDDIYISFQYPYEIWHGLLWKIRLQDMFPITWRNNYTSIAFTDNDKEKVYEKLFLAADYLYEHRIEYRNIRKQSAELLHANLKKKASDEEREQELIRIGTLLL